MDVSTPVTHLLAAWLAKFITCPSLASSLQFTFATQDVISHVPGVSQVSMLRLDVDSLLTKVLLDDVLAFLQRKLPVEDPRLLLTDVFLQLIRLCVESNSFSSEGRFYPQTFGVAMGSPLSPVLANLYMEFFDDSPPKETWHLPVLSLHYTEEIYSLRRPLQSLNCRHSFHQMNTVVTWFTPALPLPRKWAPMLFRVPPVISSILVKQTPVLLSICQHKYAVSRGHSNNALFCHQWDTGHQMDWRAACIVFPSADVHARKRGSSLIKLLPNFNLNSGFSPTDSLLDFHILHLLPYADIGKDPNNNDVQLVVEYLVQVYKSGTSLKTLDDLKYHPFRHRRRL
ncbi:uncharacterized protein [Penaeus vannamei]|uniref:uncharacterized protein n=1 Tax=Penaeus vannamei TaxID=6689 RepID=UPI00387FA9BF